jgi:hypothetical protein
VAGDVAAAAQADFRARSAKAEETIVKPKPLVVIKSGKVDDVLAQLADAKARFPRKCFVISRSLYRVKCIDDEESEA